MEHVHGGNPGQDILRLGLEQRKVLDFSVNINPLGPPEIIRKNWQQLYPLVTEYPSLNGEGVIHFYNQKYGIPGDMILPGNGSIDLIYLVHRVKKLNRVAVIDPGFFDYKRAARVNGAEIISLGMILEDGGFSFPLDLLRNKAAEFDAVAFGNPNNPTANMLPKSIILELAHSFPSTLFLVDEAFMQYSSNLQDNSLMLERQLPENLLVFNSLTKFYSLAGLRIGAVIGNPAAINMLRQGKEPWSVNGVADRCAELLLEEEEYDKASLSLNAEEKERLLKEYSQIHGVEIFPSSTNFFLGQWQKTDNLDHLLEKLLKAGIYLRDCRNFAGLENNFFRFAIRTPENNNLLLREIKEAVESCHG